MGKKTYLCSRKRKVGRVTECAGLEIRYTLFGYRGFESLTFRKSQIQHVCHVGLAVFLQYKSDSHIHAEMQFLFCKDNANNPMFTSLWSIKLRLSELSHPFMDCKVYHHFLAQESLGQVPMILSESMYLSQCPMPLKEVLLHVQGSCNCSLPEPAIFRPIQLKI